LDVGQLDVAVHLLATESNSMHWNPLALDVRNGFEIDTARIVGAVAHEHHRADRQHGCVRQHFLEAIADARGRRVRCKLVRFFQTLQMGAEAIKTNLKFTL
jgi:hypothetical protein